MSPSVRGAAAASALQVERSDWERALASREALARAIQEPLMQVNEANEHLHRVESAIHDLPDKLQTEKAFRLLWDLRFSMPDSQPIIDAASLSSAARDVDGAFVLSDLEPGDYVVYAECMTHEQVFGWAVPITLHDGSLRVTLEQDNATFYGRLAPFSTTQPTTDKARDDKVR